MEIVDEQNAETEAIIISIWKLGGLSWQVLARRVWREIYDGILLIHAAALSFYFLLAIFPLLLCIITVIGFFTESGAELRANLLFNLSRILPLSASALIY